MCLQVWLDTSVIWIEPLSSHGTRIDSLAISDDKRIDLAEFKQAVPLLVSSRLSIIASMHCTLTSLVAAFRLGGALRSRMRTPLLRRSIGTADCFAPTSYQSL